MWCSSLAVDPKTRDKLRSTLSTDELQRADRFHFEEDRHSFIASRGILRSILAHYLQNTPSEIGFTYNIHGKPLIANLHGDSGINFNLSHSDGVAVYAFARGRGVGIDIERLRSDLSFQKIARRFFTTREFEKLSTLADGDFIQEFFNLWTHKEAYIKARGKGLSIPLNQVSFTTNRDQMFTIKEIERDPDEGYDWSFHSLTPAPGYVGTLAVEGKNVRIKHWTWSV